MTALPRKAKKHCALGWRFFLHGINHITTHRLPGRTRAHIRIQAWFESWHRWSFYPVLDDLPGEHKFQFRTKEAEIRILCPKKCLVSYLTGKVSQYCPYKKNPCHCRLHAQAPETKRGRWNDQWNLQMFLSYMLARTVTVKRQETVVPTEARRGDVIRGGGDAVFVGGVGDRGGLLLGGDASPLGRRFYVLLLLVWVFVRVVYQAHHPSLQDRHIQGEKKKQNHPSIQE